MKQEASFMTSNLTVLSHPTVQAFIRCCNDGWEQGWHERNGGNLTYRLDPEEIRSLEPYFNSAPGPWNEMGISDKDLAGAYFIATGSGKYFRNVILKPEDSFGIVEIDSDGKAWRIVWGLDNGGRPTSEFPTHFMNHAVRFRATNGKNRVIYHAHTPHLIAMTYVLPLTAKDFSQALWRSATECPVVFPEGVGVVPWLVPGGTNIAQATCRVMEDFQAALWSHHGLFCSGSDFDETFGLMHTIEKAAQIWILAQSAGQGKIRQTITDDNLRAIAHDFGVTLNEDMLG
jgi:rhamnulose-1-phosphate aldolase